MSNLTGLVYPPLTREEFAHFLWRDWDFVKREKLTISLRRRVARGLHGLFLCKWHGHGGYKRNRKEAVLHYDKACIYDPVGMGELEYAREAVERYRKNRKPKHSSQITEFSLALAGTFLFIFTLNALLR